MMKKCKKCNKEKPITDFHKHPKMKSGYINDCKACVSVAHKKYAEENKEYLKKFYHEWRKKNRKMLDERTRKWAERNPGSATAHALVGLDLKTGKLTKKPCEVCGKFGQREVVAHHCDYNKPREVMWLCLSHHKEWHKNNKAIPRVSTYRYFKNPERERQYLKTLK